MVELYNFNKFNVLFYGNWQPLHGLDIVAQAIVLLKPFKQVCFTLIGSKNGNVIRENAENYLKKHKAKNYCFMNNMPMKKLVEYIQNSELVLAGGFQDNEKAKIVIRNSTYEAMACQAFILVPDTPANNEILKDNYSCFMCKPGNPKSLAQRVLDAKGNQEKLA